MTVVELCHLPRPADVDSVEFGGGAPPEGFVVAESSLLDGVEVQRGETASVLQPDNGVRVWSSAVYLPRQGLWIRAESSRGPEQVDEALGRLALLGHGVGVPPRGWSSDGDLDDEQETELYARRLSDLGLEVAVERRAIPGPPEGHLLEVSPHPGTVVPVGTRVVLTVVGD